MVAWTGAHREALYESVFVFALMSLTASAPPAPARPAPLPVAWILAIVLVAAAAASLVAAASFGSPAPCSGTLTLTDDLGRKVCLTAEPARVVVLGPNIVDMMVHLGLRASIVGVDCYNGATASALASDYTQQQIALWSLSPSMCVEALPFVPSTLANLTPDLVLASTIVSTSQVEQATGELGIPLVVLQPPTLQGILVDDALLGEIFDEPARAVALNAQLSSVLDSAAAVVAGSTSLPTALLTYAVDASGYWTYGPGSFGQSLLDLSGASNIAASAPIPYPELSATQVVAAQPEQIVCAVGFGVDLSSYQSAPDWSNLLAVSAGNVTGIDSTWLTEAGPTMILSGIPEVGS